MIDVIIKGERIKDIDLCVFDKDGTLIDIYNYWANMVELRANGICDLFGIPREGHRDYLMYEMGIDIENGRLKPQGPVGMLTREVVQKYAEGYLLDIGLDDVSEGCFKVFKEVDEKSLDILDELVKPIDGAIDLLKKIKGKGCKIAIATTDRTERADLAINFLKINDLIDLTVGVDQVKASKPFPDMLNLIVDKLGVSPENSVMIGDARTDILMGNQAKFKASIGVSSGMTHVDVLSDFTPYVVNDVSCIEIE